MWGAASFASRCARCSGTPVWVRGGRSSRRCPYRVAVPPVGGGAPPALGGRRAAPVAPQLGWVRGGGGGPPRSLSGLCGRGGGGGEWGGSFGSPATPPVGQKRGGGGRAAWRSQPRGPAIGQGGRALPPPPSTECRILTRSLPGAPHLPTVAARRRPAGGGREGQRSVVIGLRGRFPWVGNKAGVPWRRAVHGGRGHPYHSGSRPFRFAPTVLPSPVSRCGVVLAVCPPCPLPCARPLLVRWLPLVPFAAPLLFTLSSTLLPDMHFFPASALLCVSVFFLVGPGFLL